MENPGNNDQRRKSKSFNPVGEKGVGEYGREKTMPKISYHQTKACLSVAFFVIKFLRACMVADRRTKNMTVLFMA